MFRVIVGGAGPSAQTRIRRIAALVCRPDALDAADRTYCVSLAARLAELDAEPDDETEDVLALD